MFKDQPRMYQHHGSQTAKLRKANLNFRNDIISGPGGSEILLDDPSGNPIELFRRRAEELPVR